MAKELQHNEGLPDSVNGPRLGDPPLNHEPLTPLYALDGGVIQKIVPSYPDVLRFQIENTGFDHHPHAKSIASLLKELAKSRLAYEQQVVIAVRMLLRLRAFHGDNSQQAVAAIDRLSDKAWEIVTEGLPDGFDVSGCDEAIFHPSAKLSVEHRLTDPERFYSQLVSARLLDLICEIDTIKRKQLLKQCVLAFLNCLDGSLSHTTLAPDSERDREKDLLSGIAALELDVTEAIQADDPYSQSELTSLLTAPLWIEQAPAWWSFAWDWRGLHERLAGPDDVLLSSTAHRERRSRLRSTLELRYPALVIDQSAPISLSEATFAKLRLPPIEHTLTIEDAIKLVQEVSPHFAEVRESMRATIERWLHTLGAVKPDAEQGAKLCEHVNELLRNFRLALRLDDGVHGYMYVKINTSGNVYLAVRNRESTRSLQNSFSRCEVVLLD